LRRKGYRSLLTKLLWLSLGVATVAVSATALLATYGTGERPAIGASLLETDSEILSALYTYANEHRSWDEVGPLVRELAERTGRRIAVTTPEGEQVADSADATGRPATPAARIDATTRPNEDITAQPNVVVPDPARGPGLAFYVWQLTEQEQRERQPLADEAANCLRHTGTGGPKRATRHYADGPGAPLSNPCIPAALVAQSSASRAMNERAEELTNACLDEHDPAPNSPEWTQCADTALTEAKRPYVAPPANLYLGESDRFDPFSPTGWWRTAMTVAAVLLAATVVTVLAGRRLLRPIHTLTTAAQRMAAGDRAAQVPAQGNDEVTRLATAFNTMADAIASTERQHKALVSDVAHELRTPLANVRSHLEAAKDGVLPLDPALVRSLIEESALLERLVADLQDLALADAGMLRMHPEERDGADLAEQAVAAHRAKAEASGVELLFAAEPVVVHADPARLRQAIGNLVTNAIRHTPPGGMVSVTVTGTADTAVFTVTDTGSGIAAEHLPHIFDRLYRADPSRTQTTGGNGLGLAITKHLVEAHHGQVEATSTPGEGSTFTIRLRRDQDMSRDPQDVSQPGPGPGLSLGGASVDGLFTDNTDTALEARRTKR
jgi:two-component system sensor histidine kinase BaeS